MKRKITQFLMLLMALVWAIPASAALEYEIKLTKTAVAEKAFTAEQFNATVNGSVMTAKSMTVANGIVYFIKPNATKIHYWDPMNDKIGTISEDDYTAGQVGWGISSDDKGNIVFQCKGDFTSKADYFCVYKSSGKFGKKVSASGKKEWKVPSGYSDSYASANGAHFINAEGNCMGRTEKGYIWIATYSQKIARINIKVDDENGEVAPTLTKYAMDADATWSTTYSEYNFQKYADGEYLFYGRNMPVYDCTQKYASGGDSKVTIKKTLVSGSTHDNAPDIEYLQGHKIFVYLKGDTYETPNVVVKDLTAGKTLSSSLSALPTDAPYEHSTKANGVPVWSRFEMGEDENTLYLYTFVPGCGFKKFKITAKATNAYTDPVASLTAEVQFLDGGTQHAVLTWTAPSANADHVANYKIYRGDTEIATVGSDVLTYTDTEALTAETTYKVIPVYDNDVTVGTDVTVTVAPLFDFAAPSGLKLEIAKILNETDGDISHFTATATWSSPETYNSSGDYAIHYYKVELLDKNNNVIDSREISATESLDAETYEPQSYSVTYCTTDDLSNSTDVEVGNESNYFIDDDCLYTVRVTTVYDLREVVQGTSTASDMHESTVQSCEASLNYEPEMEAPKGTVTIYKGTSGAVTNNYRIEINIESPSLESAPVSYYELFITRKNIIWDTEVVTLSEDANYSYQEETEQITDFVLVTSDGITEGASNVPGSLVREGKNGQYRADSQYAYIAYNYDANYDKNNYTGKNYDPTTWTYSLNAVYADDNSLLRKSNEATLSLTPDFIETDVEEVIADGMNLNAYPMPAETELTIQSGQAIEQVIIQSTSGAEVKRIDGNGEMKMTIDVEDLVSGYYFLKVNDLPMMKIVKK